MKDTNTTEEELSDFELIAKLKEENKKLREANEKISLGSAYISISIKEKSITRMVEGLTRMEAIGILELQKAELISEIKN